MKQQYKVSNSERYNSIHDFLNTIDIIIEYFHNNNITNLQSDLSPWFNNLRVQRGRKDYPGNIFMYAYLSQYLGIDKYSQIEVNKIFGSKFVYVQAVSLADLIFYLFEGTSSKIRFSKVNLPEHSDLKEFLVPLELFPNGKYNFSYKIDWQK